MACLWLDVQYYGVSLFGGQLRLPYYSKDTASSGRVD